MAEEMPSLHIDTDWKKQAQEEKRKLAEQEGKVAAAKSAPPSPVPAAAPSASAPASVGPSHSPATTRQPRGRQEIPAASFATLVETMMTQALYALMEVQSRGGDPVTGLDLAKHHIDTLAVLDEKCKGNLTSDEQKLLDSSLYQVRMQYVQVASRHSM